MPKHSARDMRNFAELAFFATANVLSPCPRLANTHI
jgi:hypothetical protein